MLFGKNKNENAQALSKIGASLGGIARAKSLSPEARKTIAKKAAETRWGGSERAFLPRETHTGTLNIGDREIPCSVLDNGKRVFSIKGLTRAFGGSRTGGPDNADQNASEPGAPRLPPFLASKSLYPFINKELTERLLTPIPFVPIQGGRNAFGYEAIILPEVCKAVLAANKTGNLKFNQAYLVESAELLLMGFANVGVIALVDEATGYQAHRAKDELLTILKAYIAPELLPWTQKFPPEFFEQIYKLHGWDYPSKKKNHPQYVGTFINKYVYEKLAPGVLEELRKKNPTNDYGYRAHRHHQFLTPEIGNPHLEKQISNVMAFMRGVAGDKDLFKMLFDNAFPTNVVSPCPPSAPQKQSNAPADPSTQQ